jgi:4-nitrophenyl phosphatase
VPIGSITTLLLDLDGVVYTGNTPVPDAPAFFDFLKRSGRRFQCITNNSTLSAEQFAEKLGGMGIPVAPSQVLTSSQATALHLRERFPAGARVLAIGEEGLVRALVGQGFRLVTHPPDVDVVVCGLDRQLTYERLKQACSAILAGAAFVATNPDRFLPTEEGFHPGNGAALAYLSAATGVTPEVTGKPEATMVRVAMDLLGATPGETAIVGDGLHTDIVAGARAGVTTVLVLTGVSTRAHLAEAPHPPDYVFDTLAALRQALG